MQWTVQFKNPDWRSKSRTPHLIPLHGSGNALRNVYTTPIYLQSDNDEIQSCVSGCLSHLVLVESKSPCTIARDPVLKFRKGTGTGYSHFYFLNFLQ